MSRFVTESLIMDLKPICLVKMANEHFHFRSHKLTQWSFYEMNEITMLGALSYYFPKLQPLAIYSVKKPVLAISYAFLAYSSDKIIEFAESYYGHQDCSIEPVGQDNSDYV